MLRRTVRTRQDDGGLPPPFHLAYRGGRAVPADAYPTERLLAGDGFDDLVLDVCRAGHPEPDWVHRERGFVLNDAEGRPDCLVLVICDATEAYEAEERSGGMFNANPAPTLIALLDDRRFVRVNDGSLELSGWREDEVVGRVWG